METAVEDMADMDQWLTLSAWVQVGCQLALLYLARIVGLSLQDFRQWKIIWTMFAAGFSCMLASRVLSLLLAYGYWWTWLQPLRIWVIPLLVNAFLIGAMTTLVRTLRRVAPMDMLISPPLVAHITITIESLVTTWDSAAEQMFGYTAQEAAGRTITELIIPEHLRVEHMTGIARYQDPEVHLPLRRTYNTLAIHRDQSQFPVIVEINVVPQADGTRLFAGTITRLLAG